MCEVNSRATARRDGVQRKLRDASRESTASTAKPHRRPGPGRPPKAKWGGPVFSRRAQERLDSRYRGTARTLLAYLERYTGDALPGFACLRMADVMADVGVKLTQLKHLRAQIAGDVRTAVVRGALFVWSPNAAYALTKTGRWSEWLAHVRLLEQSAAGTPFLPEVRAWIEKSARAGRRTPQKPRKAGGEPQLFSMMFSFYNSPCPEGVGEWLVSPPKNIGNQAETGAPKPGRKTGPVSRSIPQRYSVSSDVVSAPLKQGREIQDHAAPVLGSSPDPENQPPPLSLDPRDVRPGAESGASEPPAPPGGGLNGFRGEREAPARALSDTVTAEHVPGGSPGTPPTSETRLRAARADEEEDDVTREEQIEALRAIEAGEVQLPIAPTRPAPSPDGRPVRLGEVAPSGPVAARARPRASGGTVTPGILKAALLAAMVRHKPGWTFKGGVRNDEAIYELGRRYCANRTVEWLGYWLEEQVRRFVVDPRADGHQPTGLVLFLRVKGVTEPYIPEPEGKFPPLGSGDPPPIAELFAALDKASADMWSPRKASEG